MDKISTPNNSHPRGASSSSSAPCNYFPLGSRIEVQMEDDDLYPVYYSATVVPPPPPARENSKLLCVEYDNLVATDGGPDRLIQLVNISLVRPKPPSQEVVARGFVRNDVVDAYYRDGWWTGVVSRVVEGGERFAVAFEMPPEEHEFGLSELRAHCDWVDGVWTWPHELPSEMGMKVEISLNDFQGVWFPAEIVQSLENGAFLVKYSGKDGVLVTSERVDCLHVRPSPPALKIAKFRESEKVEAFFNFGWWSGVITNALDKNGYSVLFDKEANLNNVFDRSELRPFMDWKDGKWVTVSIPVDAMDSVPPSSIRSCTIKKRRGNYVGSMKKKKKNNKGEIEDANQVNEVTTIEKILEVENAAGEVGQIAMKKKHNVNGEIEDADQEQEHEVTATEKMLEIENAVGKEGGRIEEMGSNQVTTTEKILEVENAVGEEEGRIEGAMTKKHNGEIEDADQENVVKMLEVENAVGIEEPEPNELPGIELTNLPFVKRNAAWKSIESMEIFRKLPQKPHFKPLEQFKECLREGLAIGWIVNFTNTVDRCCSLKIGDPKCAFDEMQEVLLDLEGHGFDVGIVQRRIINMLEMKEREEKLVQEMKELNNHISEHGDKRSKIKREIGAINEHLRRLREQLSIKELAEANEVDEIARLEARLKEVEQHIKNMRCDFEGVVVRF